MTVRTSSGGGVLASLDTNVQDNYDSEDDSYSEEESKSFKKRSKSKKKNRKSVGGGSRRPRKSFLCVDDDEDDEEAYLSPLVHSDSEGETKDNKMESSLTLDDAIGLTPSKATPSKAKAGNKEPTTAQKQRRRRRSSARFLRLSGRFDGSNSPDGGTKGDGQIISAKSSSSGAGQQEHLGELYRQAIRMNAENKINAGNSWGLRLIENMDKFIDGDDEDDKENNGSGAAAKHHSQRPSMEKSKNSSSSSKSNSSSSSSDKKKKRRVNFTKASCALDASVKIYSCRVDDVHLTSYRVLANLNRTDRGKGEEVLNSDDVENGEESAEAKKEGGRARRKNNGDKGRMTETLESNVANINMSKLDSAYDIDPLFHKMSKAFDEGGAKGLLLVNLKNSDNGIGIVLDSKEDSVAANSTAGTNQVDDDDVTGITEEEEKTSPEGTDDHDDVDESEKDENVAVDWQVLPEGEVDIAVPSSKIGYALNGSSVDSVPLVPQLCGLREKFARLEEDGYVKDDSSKKSNRYANSEEEEKEAEEIIHREHLERTQASLAASMANTSFAFSTTSEGADEGFAMNDFDAGDDDMDGFGEFAPVGDDDNLGRFSSVSFSADNEFGAHGSMSSKSSTAMKLNALCSSAALGGGGDYDYFSTDFLEKVTSGNQWAGSSHWTKKERLRCKKTKQDMKETSGSSEEKKKTQKERTFVTLTSSRPSELSDLFKKKPSTKKGRSSDPLQLSQAAKKKQLNANNLLPPDAGIGIEQLSCLFLRPNAAVKPVGRDMGNSIKNVGFREDVFPTMDGFDDGDDNDGGIGFDLNDGNDNFGSMDDDIVESLEGIRKVEKVEVGYATIAKKVDVRKLKKELWAELEAKTTKIEADEDKLEQTQTEDEDSTEKQFVSFQETVREMDTSQSQADVTIAYYFICLLHLANEKGLRLDASGHGLEDFIVYRDDGKEPLAFTEADSEVETSTVASQRGKRKQNITTYNEVGNDFDDEEDKKEEEDYQD